MKFELAPNNRDQPDSVLLDDLRATAARLGVAKLTREAYSRSGRFGAATVAAPFGGWGEALLKAGVGISRNFNVSRDQCVLDLQRVAAEIDGATVTVADYRRRGRYSEKPFQRHFAKWAEALAAAGLTVSEHYHRRIDDDDLFGNIESVWQQLGRQPTVNDMHEPVSRFSAQVYKRRFGGFRRALAAFVAAAAEASDETTVSESGSKVSGGGPAPAAAVVVPRSGPRTVGWRLRYIVLKRDRFQCGVCGRSPAREPGTVLEVDHIVPWSRGGATGEANLQTLCQMCNGGRGLANRLQPMAAGAIWSPTGRPGEGLQGNGHEPSAKRNRLDWGLSGSDRGRDSPAH